MKTWSFSAFAIAGLFCVVVPIHGDEGGCRYDETACSCKLGNDSQGVCWDRVGGTAAGGTCASRFCRVGWTCSCAGRTHMCSMVNTTVHVIDRMISSNTADCHEETELRPSGAEPLELGSWTLELSRRGMLANACGQVAWYVNGELMGNYGNEPEVTVDNLDGEMARRSSHSLLGLKAGDLVAFRLRNASYYCYNHRSVFRVNGTTIDTAMGGTPTWFSKSFSPNWFSPTFSPTFATDEATAGTYDFIGLRNVTRNTGAVIVPGGDLWEMDDRSLDHMTSNFYFRIQL